ncbi:MAG: hypothetical protein KDE58_24110, partial [Caldilineaceae bacterium]|nr:hypothetical protein [Caldilineaceae bacterium]
IVDEIDWGDSLESVDMKIGRPVRIELSLYKLLDVAMKAYTMVMLANPSSPDEVQGACATDPTNAGGSALTYDSLEATVYSPNGRLVIQSLIGDKESIDASDLEWENDHWVDMDPDDSIGVGNPIQVSFSGELNVGGKVIYGLSQGGWKPTAAGDYRITFYLPTDENTFFDAETTIRVSAETEEITAEAEDTGGGLAYVDSGNNLTYIDISVVAGGGGGGGGGKGKPGADVDVLRPNAGDCECDCECLCLEECIPGQDCECECQCEESCPNCDCAPLEGSAVTNGATHEIYLPLISH